MSVIRVLGRAGDTVLKWDLETGIGMESARILFEEKTRLGYLAFLQGPGGEGSELIRNFDLRASSIILAPRLVGG